MTLLEIVIAVVVLASALLPVLVMTSSTARRTVSMEHHVVAGHFAAGIMDHYLALGFEECRRAIAGETFPWKVLDLDLLRGSTADEAVNAEVGRTFRGFQFEVRMEEPAGSDRDQMVTLVVTVSWPAPGSTNPDRKFVLRSVKFHEEP